MEISHPLALIVPPKIVFITEAPDMGQMVAMPLMRQRYAELVTATLDEVDTDFTVLERAHAVLIGHSMHLDGRRGGAIHGWENLVPALRQRETLKHLPFIAHQDGITTPKIPIPRGSNIVTISSYGQLSAALRLLGK